MGQFSIEFFQALLDSINWRNENKGNVFIWVWKPGAANKRLLKKSYEK